MIAKIRRLSGYIEVGPITFAIDGKSNGVNVGVVVIVGGLYDWARIQLLFGVVALSVYVRKQRLEPQWAFSDPVDFGVDDRADDLRIDDWAPVELENDLEPLPPPQVWTTAPDGTSVFKKVWRGDGTFYWERLRGAELNELAKTMPPPEIDQESE